MPVSIFYKKTKTDVGGKKYPGKIVHLRSGKMGSVPFLKYSKTDQVFKTSAIPLVNVMIVKIKTKGD